MKTHYLLPILSITASLALHAQGPDKTPPPPGQPQDSSQQNERRERFQKMAEQFREQRGKDGKGSEADRRECRKKMAEHFREQRGGGEGQSQERAEHIREAMKHLKAAGLGPMAERIEGALKQMRNEHGNSPAAQSQDQSPRGPQPRGPFGGPQQYGRPTPLSPDAPAPMEKKGAHPNAGNHDDLQIQVQRLARQVEELRNMIQNRKGDAQGQKGSRAGEHHKRRPQGNGPHHKNRESKSETNPPEEIKPAL